MQRPLLIGIVIFVGALAAIAYASLFTVYQTQQALILRFGEAKRTITEPGLNWKVPVADTVIFLENRILDLDSPVQEVIASDRKRLVVDAFARYKIVDPLKFFQTMNNVAQANSRLANVLNSAVRRVLGDATFSAIVRDDRPALMKRISSQTNLAAGGFGIEIIDVRIRRADLPEANSQAVYRRMQTERQREAAEARAQGQEASQRVRSRADRDVVVIEAEATQEAETTRGEGDATRNQIFNEAFGKDPEFFTFYRSMQAYTRGLKSSDTRLVISPNSAFFRYFNDPKGRPSNTPAPGG